MYEIDTILDGPYWKEKVRVITSRQISDDMIKLEAVGVETDKYYSQIISGRDLDKIKIEEETDLKFSGEGEGFFLYIESHRIRNAFQFDPLYAVNVSQVDPLPHQIDAVYYCSVSKPSGIKEINPVRDFLLNLKQKRKSNESTFKSRETYKRNTT